jgi:L-threonylcarbamoyladenylate synthase
VYGLGANALNGVAARRIFEVKGRRRDNPLIAHVASPEAAEALCHVDERAKALMRAFWPGPLTLLLPKKPVVPPETNAGLAASRCACPAIRRRAPSSRRAACPWPRPAPT